MAGKAIIRASARGARSKGHSLRAAGRMIQRDILDEFAGTLKPRAVEVTRGFAPHLSGRLERGLTGRVRSYGGRITIEILSTARSDEGFDYLPVTRFGHGPIYPKKPGGVLRFIPSPDRVGAGRPVYVTFVGPWKPDRDWVESAFDALQRELDNARDRLGRAIDRRLLA